MNQTKYTAILFDLDDTLLDFTACEIKSLKRACSLTGMTLSAEWSEFWQTYQTISPKYWQQKHHQGFS